LRRRCRTGTSLAFAVVILAEQTSLSLTAPSLSSTKRSISPCIATSALAIAANRPRSASKHADDRVPSDLGAHDVIHFSSRYLAVLAVGLCLTQAAGCDQHDAQVTGTITIDGKELPQGANGGVAFHPV